MLNITKKLSAGLALSALFATSAFAQTAAPAMADAPAATAATAQAPMTDMAKPGHEMKGMKGDMHMKGMKHGHHGKKNGMSPSATAKRLADPSKQGGNM